MPSDYGKMTDTPAEASETDAGKVKFGDTGRRAMQESVSDQSATTAMETKGEWVDRGIQDVPVTDLPSPEDVDGPQDFNHHISYDDAIAATHELQNIKPSVAQGWTGDDFSAADEKAGLDYANGQRRVYDLYYGRDPIRLNKDGSEYHIIDGRHRVYAAKVVGLDTVPAHVIERK